MGEINRNKIRHKEIISLLYDRRVLQSNSFDLVYWAGFEHMITRVPHLLHLWVVKCVSYLCGENDMRYKWKEVLYTGCPFGNWQEVNKTELHQLYFSSIPRM